MHFPALRKPARAREEPRLRCPGHLAFVRAHACSVPGCQGVPIEAAHVRTGTNGGVGMKPDDCWSISLCSEHHREQHQIGEPAFERRHGINMKALAQEFAKRSGPWQRFMAKRRAQG